MSERTETIAAELSALRDENGKIVATEVVRWARRNKKSKLHAALTWDDEIAGERYRLWQVREMISVHIVDADGGRQFVSLSIDRKDGGGYRPISDVIARPDLREIMLADALAELDRLQRRYDKLKELSTVWSEADKVRSRRKRATAA